MALMLWGTSSNAGKTTLSAGICRYLARKGRSVAPYKASNLSLNSWVTESGAEIGIGQAIQAWACRIEPEAEMNPILLKPAGKGVIQYVVDGRIYPDGIPNYEKKLEIACRAYDRISSRYDDIICEGSGSPAEVNMTGRDVANIGIVRERPMSVVLVSDIERGGVFAAIYGTWLLIPEDIRPLMKGYIINRFRGEASILKSAIDRIDELTGMRCLGILPYRNIILPEEDSVSSKSSSGGYDDIRKAYEDSLEALADLVEENLDTELLESLISSCD